MNIKNFGWIGVAAIGGMMLASGFQGNTQKIGVVDVAKIFQESDYTKARGETLRKAGTDRADILQFLRTYPIVTSEQAVRFKELKLKAAPTANEKAEITKIQTDAQASDKKLKQLQQNSSPSDADIAQLQDYTNRRQTIGKLEQQWAREFDNDVREMQSKMREEVIGVINVAVSDIAKKQGYSVVFAKDMAPYAANDLTQETLTAVNAKK